ncbi:MAG: DUF488 family protein [Clostridiales bacterium]|nr:DUF488 family protein [Clostridiales bacterium]
MLLTVQMAKAKTLPAGTRIIDITIKSSRPPWDIFAPTWNMVNAYKAGELSEEGYTEQYINLMRKRYKENKNVFQQLIQMAMHESVALACYCTPGEFCHRHILKNILQKIEPRLEYIEEPTVEQAVLF